MQFSMQTVLVAVFLAIIGIDVGLAQCPAGKGCFRFPPGCGDAGKPMCEALVTWMANDAGGIDFSTLAKNHGNDPRWMAIGFSGDDTMGDDDILMCRQTTAEAVVLEHYWSIGESIELETSTQDGLSNVVTSFKDGYISCSFTRAVSVAGQAHIYNLGLKNQPAMTPMYHYFFGIGPTYGDTPLQHEHDPFHTPTGVDYTMAGEVMVDVGGGSESHEHESTTIEPDGNQSAAGQVMASALVLMMMTCLAIFIN